jgi:hypothetical protein
MRTSPSLAVATVVLALGSTGCGRASQRGTAAKVRTEVQVYQPFSASGHSLLRSRARPGYCYEGSFAIDRRDAWRCTARHLGYDPCFSSPRAPGVVLCPDRPWKRTGVSLKLTKALPRGHGNRGAPSVAARPWALKLHDGNRCTYITGARGGKMINGRFPDYECEQGRYLLWGLANRRTQPWTIFIVTRESTRLTRRAAIDRAWM